MSDIQRNDQYRALGLSTFAFSVCFAVWTLFSIIGISIKQELGLSDTQFGILVATPILTGSVSRLFLGIWTEKYGARIVFPLQMSITGVAVWMLSAVEIYELFLLAALGLGLAGGSFIVGVTYVSKWFEQKHQGTALGIFGAGNVGAAVTSFFAPVLVVMLGWEVTAQVYAVVLIATAAGFYIFSKPEPGQCDNTGKSTGGPGFASQLAPLKNIQVWRFAIYYFFVFGSFISLASFLPRYYVGAHDLALTTAGVLAGIFTLPGSVFRMIGGWLSDRWGARQVMYLTFSLSLAALFIMSVPNGIYSVSGVNGAVRFDLSVPLGLFVGVSAILGFAMSLGSAAVFKHIPAYYPQNVGAVGGLVGMIGGLGGFFLPIGFGIILDATGVWTTPFMLLFGVGVLTVVWMHLAIRKIEYENRSRQPGLARV